MRIAIPRPNGSGTLEVQASDLDLVRLVAFSRGYMDVDVEPYPERFTITATGPGGSLVGSGKTVSLACDDFLNRA